MGTLEVKTPCVRLTPLCLQKRLREFKINFPKKLNTKQFYKKLIKFVMKAAVIKDRSRKRPFDTERR